MQRKRTLTNRNFLFSAEALERREMLSGNGLMGGAINGPQGGDGPETVRVGPMMPPGGQCEGEQTQQQQRDQQRDQQGDPSDCTDQQRRQLQQQSQSPSENCDELQEQTRDRQGMQSRELQEGPRGRVQQEAQRQAVQARSQSDPGASQRMQREGGDRGRGEQDGSGDPSDESNPLTTAEQDSLRHMREEEKLARDVYTTLAEQYDLAIFSNIAASESRHMAAVANLLTRYDIDDPVEDDTVGVFSEESGFTELYEELVEVGSTSVVDALKVGALIEELDIFDLRNALEVVEHDDIERVYNNLLQGSENHLRAFASQLAASGESYTVDGDYLTQEEFDAIASSPRDTGSGAGSQEQQTRNRLREHMAESREQVTRRARARVFAQIDQPGANEPGGSAARTRR